MGIFKRISDIVSANLHDLAEEYEDPELMLKQAVREMEESIADATQQTAKAMANEKTLDRELQRNRQQADQWRERAEKAVESGDDDLARKALARKIEHEKLMAALQDQLASAAEASQSLRRQLDGMKAKVAEAKRNLATLSARKRAADFRKRMEHTTAGVSTEISDDAFAKFQRLKGRVEQAEAEAEALAELRGGTSPPDDDREMADVGADVSAELAELKRKLKGDH